MTPISSSSNRDETPAKNIVVVEKLKNWPLNVPGVRVELAKDYLTSAEYARARGLRVFNLCRSYRYQSIGYYVSLLAEARGHKPFPSISTIQDLKSVTLIRFAGDDLDAIIQRALAPIQSDQFTLSVYFGRNMAKRYERLADKLFTSFRAPLLRAEFKRNGRWELASIKPIAAKDIPDPHRPFVVECAREYVRLYRPPKKAEPEGFYDLAILHDAEDDSGPSNKAAVKKFVKAAEALDCEVEVIGRDDYDRLAEFDALLIRDTTNVNHYTFRFARRAAAEGLVVIDDPESILRCTNKVYLAELLSRHKVPIPRTMIVNGDNVEAAVAAFGFPIVLKQPDSYYSHGVIKVKNREELAAGLDRMLERSEFIVAQEYVPTTFDWRVGVLGGRPIYVCKYFMAGNHWQIVKRTKDGRTQYGNVETLAVEAAPARIVRAAVKAARLIGDGFYGVDLKQTGRRVVVIEVNDNPSIDAGIEDAHLGDELYRLIIAHMVERIERRRTKRMNR